MKGSGARTYLMCPERMGFGVNVCCRPFTRSRGVLDDVLVRQDGIRHRVVMVLKGACRSQAITAIATSLMVRLDITPAAIQRVHFRQVWGLSTRRDREVAFNYVRGRPYE